jgi:hypothetical protein
MSSLRMLEPSDIDHEAEQDERLWQRYCTAAKQLDVGEVLTAVGAEIAGETAETPLSDFIHTQLVMPQYDPFHPLVSPTACERLGRWLAGLVCEHIHRAVGVAMGRED